MKYAIAQAIEDEKDENGLEAAQALYRAAFVKTKCYKRHKDGVDTILETDGYGDCIVTE